MGWPRIRKFLIVFAALFAIVPVFERLFAQASAGEQTQSGYMVDSECYEAAQRNVNPWDTQGSVNRDVHSDVKYCVPKEKAKSFSLVQKDWNSIRFDSAGDAKAREFVHQTGKQDKYWVNVTGEFDKKILRVESISMAK